MVSLDLRSGEQRLLLRASPTQSISDSDASQATAAYREGAGRPKICSTGSRQNFDMRASADHDR
jgi:hypothetical protein